MHAYRATMLLGAGLLLAGACAADQPSKFTAALDGTPHDALYSVALLKNVGVAVGANGAILESLDAGRSWKAVAPAPTALALLSVSLQPGYAVATGQSGLAMVMGADGRWNKVDTGTDKRLFGVSVNAWGVAAAVGAFGTALASSDGGRHWTPVAPQWEAYSPNGEDPHLYCVSVDDHGAMTVAGEFGLILRSADGGKSWHQLHKGDASIFALELRADGVGYAVGQSGLVLRTADGGQTWQDIAVGSGAILLGVHSSGDQVVITGMHEILASDDAGRTWRHAGDGQTNATWYQAVAGAAPSGSNVLVGAAGSVLRIKD